MGGNRWRVDDSGGSIWDSKILQEEDLQENETARSGESSSEIGSSMKERVLRKESF